MRTLIQAVLFPRSPLVRRGQWMLPGTVRQVLAILALGSIGIAFPAAAYARSGDLDASFV